MKRIRTVILAARPWSFSMTAISVILASIASVGVRPFGWPSFLLVLAGMILVHAATNLINDYFDFQSGVDRPDSPTARYRSHPLLEGTFSPSQILAAAIGCYVVAGAIAAVLAFQRGWIVLVFAGAGAFASLFYTAGPVRYKHLALGELSVFLMWGPLMMLATSTIITGGWERAERVGLISILQGLWVALVIYANNLKDISYDRETGVRTLANLLGKTWALRIFAVALAVIYGLTAALIAFAVIPLWGIAVALSIPISAKLVADLARSPEIPAEADPLTARAGMVYGLLLILSLLADMLVR